MGVLTEEQKAIIRELAIKTVYSNVECYEDCLRDVVTAYVDNLATLEQLYAISKDTNIWSNLLPFNPITGKGWAKDA